jgi:hypothetical protein
MRRGRLARLRAELESEGIPVIETGLVGMLARVLRAALRGQLLYVPTPHPVPFVGRQVIVVHDSYPFMQSLGSLKRNLLRWSVLSSRCTVAHINRSICLPFLSTLGIGHERLLFAPNIPPAHDATRGACAQEPEAGGSIRVGAFGTDSPKKNYASLLGHPALAQGRIRLAVYGEENDYSRGLLERYGPDAFELVDPSKVGLFEFIASVRCVASVAIGEGFGRPLATAITSGIGCHLLASPSFDEFFRGNALMYDTVDDLCRGILDGRVETGSPSLGFRSPAYRAAIDSAVQHLESLA